MFYSYALERSRADFITEAPVRPCSKTSSESSLASSSSDSLDYTFDFLAAGALVPFFSAYFLGFSSDSSSSRE